MIAMNAWSKSIDNESNGCTNKVMKCRDLLNTMLSKFDAGESDMKPNIIAYTSILNAAAHCLPSQPGDDSPFSIALQTYTDIQNDPRQLGISPDDMVFATMLEVITVHTDAMSEERRKYVEDIFDDACAAGQVSARVIRALRSACPGVDLLHRLLGSRKLAESIERIDELPRQWTKHVRGGESARNVTKRAESTTKNRSKPNRNKF